MDKLKLDSLLTSATEPSHEDLNAVAAFWHGRKRCAQINGSTSFATCTSCRQVPEETHSVKYIDFQLETFRQKMDAQGMTVAEHQEATLKSRRKLAETTRGNVVSRPVRR